MKLLSKFRPAETLLILEGKNVSLKELLKTTFMDLLLKQVIEITTVSKQSSSSQNKVRYYKYIVKGEGFLKFRPLIHEHVFISPYLKSSSIKILLQHLIRMGFQNSKSESAFISSLLQSPNLNSYFTRSFLQTIFGGFSITQEGLELQHKIKIEIAQLEKELPEIIHSEKERASHILKTIGGNILLLKNIDFALLKEIDSDILAEMNRTRTSDSVGSGCFGCSSWDSGCSSSGCSSSGCSSSGCSGCGGCGGCS